MSELTQPQITWNMALSNQLMSLEPYLLSEAYYEHEATHPRRKPKEGNQEFEVRKEEARQHYRKAKQLSRQECEKVIQWVIDHPYPKETI